MIAVCVVTVVVLVLSVVVNGIAVSAVVVVVDVIALGAVIVGTIVIVDAVIIAAITVTVNAVAISVIDVAIFIRAVTIATIDIGIGIEDCLEAVVKNFPAPKDADDEPLRALIFDSWFDPYQGVVALFRVFEGNPATGYPIVGMTWMLVYKKYEAEKLPAVTRSVLMAILPSHR